jgi:hypothetical protein
VVKLSKIWLSLKETVARIKADRVALNPQSVENTRAAVRWSIFNDGCDPGRYEVRQRTGSVD